MTTSWTASTKSILVIMIIMTYVMSNINWAPERGGHLIAADGKGYYAYLPAIFIYHDLNFGFFDHIENEKYYDPHNSYDYRGWYKGIVIDKYYCGTALAMLPFFICAHSFAYLSGYEADGYTKPYYNAVSFAALFYLAMALLFLNAFLSLFGFSEGTRSIVLFAIVFGSNLFYYTIQEASMSHLYSFCFFSIFLYLTKKYVNDGNPRDLIGMFTLFGIIVLIRPINGLIICSIPFVAGSYDGLLKIIKSLWINRKASILGLGIFSLIVSIQLVIYKISTGDFFVYSYYGEGFNFLSFHFMDFLFSYKKGLFLYTPIYFISLFGIFFFWKTNKFASISVLIFLSLIIYVFSSWHNWFYGGSFSARTMIEFLPFFAFLLAFSIEKMKKQFLNALFIPVIVILVVICQIQTYQYRKTVIHFSDMTKERYWENFLRVDKLIK